MSSNIQIEQNCQFCGKRFMAKTTVTKFCSHECASRNYKKQKREEKIKRRIIGTWLKPERGNVLSFVKKCI